VILAVSHVGTLYTWFAKPSNVGFSSPGILFATNFQEFTSHFLFLDLIVLWAGLLCMIYVETGMGQLIQSGLLGIVAGPGASLLWWAAKHEKMPAKQQ